MKFFLKGDWEENFTEVSREQYIDAEGEAGFFSTDDDDIATGSFDGHGVEGKVEYEENV